MADKLFTQEQVNRIVTARLRREQERLDHTFEATLKRCMAAIHLTLYQEMCAMKRDMAAETKDTLLSDLQNETQPPMPPNQKSNAAEGFRGGGEKV